MIKIRFILLLSLGCLLTAPAFSQPVSAPQNTLNILTYNIRFANPADAPNTWDARKEKVFDRIRMADPSIFGLQEALYSQVRDVEMAFPAYSRIGSGRDDGQQAGEFSPLFFNSSRFTLMASGTFWLSQTPALAGSRGWDAACNRVVTWARLTDKTAGRSFLICCTHFDHMGKEARKNSALLLLHAADSLAESLPLIVVGDFNADPFSEPYHLLTDESSPVHLSDSRRLAPETSGPAWTFTGFLKGGEAKEQIDYVFFRGNLIPQVYHVDDFSSDGFYPSDHLPVSVQFHYRTP
jgi:endonuclease/exonuclease/phosphatase family metal-dependent hydrolase